jgi:hypothetical protein
MASSQKRIRNEKASVRADGADGKARSAAGQPLVHCRSGRKARAGADDPHADVGEERH